MLIKLYFILEDNTELFEWIEKEKQYSKINLFLWYYHVDLKINPSVVASSIWIVSLLVRSYWNCIHNIVVN